MSNINWKIIHEGLRIKNNMLVDYSRVLRIHVHVLIDTQVHNYSPECVGCYNCDLGTRAFE